jgi:ABC-type sugar transport system, ATPase component
MAEVLRTEGLTKSFPGVLAVDNVSFSLGQGEVLAILGENGAGKSTLTKLICGALTPDSGCIYLEGKHVNFHSANDAMKAGIAMVYQELSMTGHMSVAENIFMNRQPTNKIGLIKKAEMNSQAQKYLDLFGLCVSPSTLVKRLSMGEQQILEILKAISLNPKVLILDEPTSSLTENEVCQLFKLIRDLKAKGLSFIYITHKLSEIFTITDRVLVMRDGKYIGTKNTADVKEQDLITMMVGREIKDLYGLGGKCCAIGEEYFRVENLSAFGLFKDVSFNLKRGEVLGIAGLIGAGRTEVACTIAGLIRHTSGKIFLEDKELKIASTSDAIEAGIGYITEDRKQMGLYLDFSITANIIAPSLEKFSRAGFIQKDEVDKFSLEQIEKFNIVTPSSKQKMMNLSGGNQQKALLAMWMSKDPKVLIFDEPTRGVDVGAKSEIYENIRKYVGEGLGAVVISSDMSELLGICDRIIIMYQGMVRGEVSKSEFTEEIVLSYASGLSCSCPV